MVLKGGEALLPREESNLPLFLPLTSRTALAALCYGKYFDSHERCPSQMYKVRNSRYPHKSHPTNA